MKTRFVTIAALLVVGLLIGGCPLISGQFQIPLTLPDPIDADSGTAIAGAQIDLNNESVYSDHKDNLKALADIALLGKVSNLGTGTVDVVVYMTPALTNYTTTTALNNDATKKQVWGPFSVTAGTPVQIKWDQSAKLFSAAGKQAILDEVKGDGQFTLYAVSSAGSYHLRINNGVLVVVIDAGE